MRNLDRLPPHDVAAEQGVLACVLLAQAECMGPLLEWFGDDLVFYDVRHGVLWEVMKAMHREGIAIDLITLGTRLHDGKNLESVGGLAYVAEVSGMTPSAANWKFYASCLWEKFIARKALGLATRIEAKIYEDRGVTEATLSEFDAMSAAFRRQQDRGTIAPKLLAEPVTFGDAVFNQFFERDHENYGWELPFSFPFRIRPGEFTLMTGDNGSGKSSLLSQVCVCLGAQGVKTVVASFETHAEVTLWMMVRQLLGQGGGRLEKTAENEKRIGGAMAWLNARIRLFDFTGIGDWRELLECYRYARERLKFDVFLVDSVMRIGIPDDDYAMQGIVASRFADFTVDTGAHLLAVIHENKSGDGGMKKRIRGNAQWADNANNVVGVKRDEKKGEKLDELKEKLKSKLITLEEHNAQVAGMKNLPDGKFMLAKQRYPGMPQNGAKYLWFDRGSLQFHDQPGYTVSTYM